MLERDGLVETAPYVGARVTTLTAKEVAETYFIRSHLESIATGLAAERITDAELAQLDVLMAKMDDAVDAQDGPAFSDLNREFHRTIVASCGNDMLRDLTMDIWQRHSGFQRVFRQVPERLAVSQREHEGIMAALRAHDAEEAARLALLHKRSVRDSVSTLVDQGGDGGLDPEATERVRWHGITRRQHPRTPKPRDPPPAPGQSPRAKVKELKVTAGLVEGQLSHSARSRPIRSASSGAVRRPSRQAAARTPAMSAPVARTRLSSSARRAPASAISRPAACPSPTSASSASGVSHSNSPRPSLTAVSSRQPPTPARRAASTTWPGGRGRPGTRSASAYEAAITAALAVDGVANRAQDRHGLIRGGRAPQPHLHVRSAGARGAQRRQRGGAGQVGQVADRGAHRALRRHDLADPSDHAGAGGAQRALGGVLDVDDVHTRLRCDARLVGVGDAHQQPHPASTRAPRLSKPTTSTRPPPASSVSMRRANSRPACSSSTIP